MIIGAVNGGCGTCPPVLIHRAEGCTGGHSPCSCPAPPAAAGPSAPKTWPPRPGSVRQPAAAALRASAPLTRSVGEMQGWVHVFVRKVIEAGGGRACWARRISASEQALCLQGEDPHRSSRLAPLGSARAQQKSRSNGARHPIQPQNSMALNVNADTQWSFAACGELVIPDIRVLEKKC